jgi:hypothetical protein
VAQILWRDAQGIEGTVPLGSTEVRIGRAMDCVIRSDDAMVSRHHARLYWGGGGYVLEDLGSANGVFYQEQRIKSHLFKHGDAIRCGSLWLRFVDEQPVAAAAPVAPAPAPISPGALAAAAVSPPTPASVAASLVSTGPARPVPSDAEIEIRVLRRRLEQMQTELRVFRTSKFSSEKLTKLEELENDMIQVEIERDALRAKVADLEATIATDGASVKVQRAIAIAAKAAEVAAALGDTISTVRIEVMAAAGEFDGFADAVPRASFELIRQSLRDAQAGIDAAREQLRALKNVGE